MPQGQLPVAAIIVAAIAVIAAISLAIDKAIYFWIAGTFLAAYGLMSVFSIASLVTLEIPGELKGVENALLRSAAIRAVTNVVFPFVLLILMVKARRKDGLQTIT